MSGYPYDHGQWPPPSSGAQPPPNVPFLPHGYQSYSNMPPPTTYAFSPYQPFPQAPPSTNAPQFPASTAYYSASEATRVAFEHNSNAYVAPELGAPTQVPAPTPGLFPVPGPRSPGAVGGDLSWSQAFPSSAAATSSEFAPYPSYQPPVQQYTPDTHGIYQQQDHQQPFHGQQHTPSVPQRVIYSPPAYLTSGLGAPAASPTNNDVAAPSKNSDLEEGELSEEDMDDAYDPEDNDISGSAAAVDTSMPRDEPSGNSKPQILSQQGAALEQAAAHLGSAPSRDASVIDTAEDEFYDEDEEEEPGEIKSTGEGASSSHSADADDEDMGFSDSSEHNSPQPPLEQKRPALNHRVSPDNASTAVVAVNGAAVAGAGGISRKDSVTPSRLEATKNGANSACNLPFGSLEQGKKEAQSAILRLIPYGVNYQTYIDEGFNEKVIHSLFSEMGLKTTPVNPAAQSGSSKAPSPQPSVAEVSQKAPGIVGPIPETPKKEERKDRIARLLALKNSSKSSPAPTPKAASKQAQPTASAPQQAHLEKTRSEKEKLLQQKLETLRRAQELRAAAAAKATVDATILSNSISSQENERGTSMPSVPVAQAIETATTTGAPAERNPATVLQPDQAGPVPGSGSRKRPVAADFADFVSTPSHPLKRQFGMTRQDSSLVIDISDDSDNDVEMELESQTDETPAKIFHGDRPLGGASFRDHPPLLDKPFSSRQQGHAPWAVRTPPRGPSGSSSRAKDDEYARKLREIEEMKRKIARAEAMKARSTPTGSLTPQTSGSSPPNSSDVPKREMQGARSDGVAIANNGEGGSSGLTTRQPSAFEVSDAVSSRSSSRASHSGQRARIASLQLPRVEASLQEKMFKLKLFQEKIAALQAEIDAGMAEKQRLKETMNELADESEDEQGESVAPIQSTIQLKADVDQSRDRIDGDQPSVFDTPDDHPEPNTGAVTITRTTNSNASTSIAASSPEASLEANAESKTPPNDLDSQHEAGSEPESESESESGSESAQMSDTSSPHEPTPDILDGDGDVVMEDDGERDEEVAGQQEHPAAALLESPGAVAAHGPASGPQTSVRGSAAEAPLVSTFVPYESPLQIFSSYRFHPQYKDQVKGGLKSLTYSGRIQDNVALCPYELEGQACPDPACGFQHFASMVPKDDQLLVELGRSDDFSGEQKARFVNGLKDVLKRVRDANVRDFDTIADEIIRFRRAFLGDDSKVVSHLEDVTI